MDDRSIQDQIRASFYDKVKASGLFNHAEIMQIMSALENLKTADKAADELYKAIGGESIENS